MIPLATSKFFAKHWAITKRRLTQAWRWLGRKLRALLPALRKLLVTSIRGEKKEREKRVLHTGWKKAVAHCAVHILPVIGIILLSYFNLAGFFIGANLQGLYDETSQAIARLCLQVTAKLLELLVIISLGVIIMDAVRTRLLFSKDGLPLGLLTAKFRFFDLTYLLSSEFRSGTWGIQHRWTCWGFILLIGTSGLLAVLVGPSTALLLVPTWHEAWPAGSASFWINGDLQPALVHQLPTWDPRCSNLRAREGYLISPNSSFASCIWAGYPYLAEAFRQRATSGERILSYSDGSFRRDVTLNWGVPDSNRAAAWPDTTRVAAYASNLAIGSLSQYIGQSAWCSAFRSARETQPGGRLANLRYRAYNSSAGSVKSDVPVVRTQCFESENYMDGRLESDRAIAGYTLLPFPVVPSFQGRRDLRIFLPVRLINTTKIVTQWISAPTASHDARAGKTSDQYPSAMLVIQNYRLSGRNSTITCSAQADWVPGTHVASGLCWGEQNSIRLRSVLNDMAPIDSWSIVSQDKPKNPEFRTAKGWRKMNITMQWLESLTPRFSAGVVGQTTLGSVLEETQPPRGRPVRDREGKFPETRDQFITISSVVASFVADGLSRIGYSENYANQISDGTVCSGASLVCPWNWGRKSWTQVFSDIINGRAGLVPDEAHRHDPGQKLFWYATVAGYGIRATSTAYYLAFTVLYIYLALVVIHVVYIARKGEVSGSWSSLTDLLVLCQTSPPPQKVLEDTSTGIRTHACMKLRMRLRENDSVQLAPSACSYW